MIFDCPGARVMGYDQYGLSSPSTKLTFEIGVAAPGPHITCPMRGSVDTLPLKFWNEVTHVSAVWKRLSTPAVVPNPGLGCGSISFNTMHVEMYPGLTHVL